MIKRWIGTQITFESLFIISWNNLWFSKSIGHLYFDIFISTVSHIILKNVQMTFESSINVNYMYVLINISFVICLRQVVNDDEKKFSCFCGFLGDRQIIVHLQANISKYNSFFGSAALELVWFNLFECQRFDQSSYMLKLGWVSVCLVQHLLNSWIICMRKIILLLNSD